MRQAAVALLALADAAALAAPPSMHDYAQGIAVEPYGAAPLLELALPDQVYQAATRADLRDVRVFNAEGAPVSHAFCAAPKHGEPIVTEQSLPVFELKDGPRAQDGDRIDVQTSAGTHVRVQEATSEQLRAADRTHIVDARGTEEPLRALRFEWSSPDGASQAHVRIEESGDLDQWRTLVPSTTLLRAGEGEQSLRRERVELPAREYEYLRVQRIDSGPPLVLRGVTAERIAPATEIEPSWFMPNALEAEAANVLLFDTARLAPVSFARLRVMQDNSSMSVTLQSRADDKSPWRERWSGEAYLVVSEAERRESPPARFDATTDRYWRVLLPKEAEAGPRPTFELGYRPLRLRFLAQGAGPYILAFGSRRADLTTPARCDGLLADVSVEERRAMIADGQIGELKTLGGETALKPAPKKTPTRMIVLWGVLIVGVGLLVAMALSLLKRVRAE